MLKWLRISKVIIAQYATCTLKRRSCSCLCIMADIEGKRRPEQVSERATKLSHRIYILLNNFEKKVR